MSHPQENDDTHQGNKNRGATLPLLARVSIAWSPAASVVEIDDEQEMHTTLNHGQTCNESKDRLPCPQGGTCSNGLLQSCQGPHLVVSDDQTQCILSTTANETMEDILQALSQMTADHYCSLVKNTFQNETMYASLPRFHISKVMQDFKHDDASLFQLLDVHRHV